MDNSNTVPQSRPQSAKDVKLTIAACYSASFTQAAVANLPPLFYAFIQRGTRYPARAYRSYSDVVFRFANSDGRRLFGTSAFALCMALSRTFYGVKGNKIPLSKTLVVCSGALAFSYLLTAPSPPIPALSLIGVALCGLSVGIMWPGTLALAGESRLGGGTLMFAILALAGDVGATLAPSVAGEVSALTNVVSTGILTGTIFPVASLILLMLYAKSIKAK